MSQIVSIGIGKAGISIQESQWNLILPEQGVDKQGVFNQSQDIHQNLNVYLKEVKENIYRPRAIFADIDSQRIDSLQNGSLKDFFMGSPMASTKLGGLNTFGEGHYGRGAYLKDQLSDYIRREAEQCDCIDSFQIQHSICGGTGSGVGASIVQILREYYCADIVNSLTMIPDTNTSCSTQVLEVYNSVLSMNLLIELVDMVLPFQNEKIAQLLDNQSSVSSYHNFDSINLVTAQLHPSISCGIRYPGDINASSRKIALNLVPFPRLKFFTCALLPFTSYQLNSRKYLNQEVPELISDSFQQKYSILNELNQTKYLTSAHTIIRGSTISQAEVEESIQSVISRSEKPNSEFKFREWIPNKVSLQYCRRSTLNCPLSVTTLKNSSAFKDVLQNLRDKFSSQLRKSAFLHYYLSIGMDQMEFVEAESNVSDLISEYIPCTQGGDYDEEEDFDIESEMTN